MAFSRGSCARRKVYSSRQLHAALPELGDDSQLPTKSGDVGLQRAELGVREVPTLQLGHPRLGHTHEFGHVRLARVAVRFADTREGSWPLSEDLAKTAHSGTIHSFAGHGDCSGAVFIGGLQVADSFAVSSGACPATEFMWR